MWNNFPRTQSPGEISQNGDDSQELRALHQFHLETEFVPFLFLHCFLSSMQLLTLYKKHYLTLVNTVAPFALAVSVCGFSQREIVSVTESPFFSSSNGKPRVPPLYDTAGSALCARPGLRSLQNWKRSRPGDLLETRDIKPSGRFTCFQTPSPTSAGSGSRRFLFHRNDLYFGFCHLCAAVCLANYTRNASTSRVSSRQSTCSG